MAKNAIQQLMRSGQSVWLDNISMSMIETGKLKEMITMGLRGMTSNPTIFDKSISTSTDYDKKILELCTLGRSTFEVYDDITIGDIQDAADIFLPLYKDSNTLDGYVSLEINPLLAYDPDETIKEGIRLYQKVNRPNVMLKVPSTEQGFQAIEELLARGININITLIFSVQQYIDSANAYLRGVKRLLQKGGDVSTVRSVASVFVSRIDTAVDTLLDGLIAQKEGSKKQKQLTSLKGTAAVANSHLIYQKYMDIFFSNEFKNLQNQGVPMQRVLWGSTSTKNPAYSDIKYVTELIGKNTVNTMPENTFYAFLDHGTAKETLTKDTTVAEQIIARLDTFGIDVNKVCVQLLEDGVRAFINSFESLLHAIENKGKILCNK